MEFEISKDKKQQVTQENIRIRVVKVDKIAAQKFELTAIKVNNNKNQSSKTNCDNNGGDNLTVLDDDDDERKKLATSPLKVILEGVWTQNNIISQNSILHLINPHFDEQNDCYHINNSQGLAVIEPDSLLTCTYVASSLFCERKTWLNHVFLGQIGTNRAMLVGTLVHETFQYGVKNKLADMDKLIKHLDSLLDDATVMLEIYSVELHLSDIRKEALGYLPSVKEWIEKYMFAGPKFPLTNAPDLEVKIVGIQDIEENVWSTKYGLKGKIDVTGLVRIHDKRNNQLVDRIIPLELKTGNPNLSSSHSAQVSLYSMMIEDRYSETNQGFVIYLKEKAAMHNVTLTHNIKRDLIQRRNQINYSMKNYFLGPDMIDQPRMCKNCERLTECILTSQLYSPPGHLDQYVSMKSFVSEAVGHLDEKFLKFFQKYHEKLIALMSRSSSVNKDVVVGDQAPTTTKPSTPSGSFWTYSSEEAETRGWGFGKLQSIMPNEDKSSLFITFKRHPNYKFTKPAEQVEIITLDSQEKPIVKKQKIFDYFKPVPANNNNNNFSHSQSQSQSPKKSKPFDTSLNFSHCRVAISLDQDDQNMDSQNSSTAIAIGFINELKEDHFVMKLYEGALDQTKSDLMYRVDKIEKRVQVDIERTVLVRLLAREDWRCDRIRQLILNEQFLPSQNLKVNHFVLTSGFDEISELESSLQKFVVEAASTDNYFILNETFVRKRDNLNNVELPNINKGIAVLARVLNTLDRSLLIVCQNIDHLVDLMKLFQMKKVKFILIDDGKSAKARHQFAANLVKVPQSSGLDLDKKYDSYIRQHESASVVITTYAMSIGGLLFTRRTFDYCVAYDCDKTELLISLSPMFCSDKYIIIDIRDEKLKDQEGVEEMKKKVDQNISLGDHLRNLRPSTAAASL